jgi:hypothetical protein
LRTAVEQELARHRSFLSMPNLSRPQPVGASTTPWGDGSSGSEVVMHRRRIVHERPVVKQARSQRCGRSVFLDGGVFVGRVVVDNEM